ncbi:CMRF35-like molecule 1 isoform X1 [Salmo salar]|uniref:CMRF35-like molecule 1 n=1 Tax=Salmo salar TaxID=8030 RepID=B5X9C2_SALSA|nr:CMRF35-like molecule 1 precursor [Salmo salar]XP_014009940.1 CMRF35-like molecule 1 isoform X1 [Salmo salar]ACI67442.1 CMRF35-like molecule 1 precursor [Salmo salar]|eukprot:NP_001134420.1 CMRF35-like molecule 1 precursor [Salmo salar]
MAPYLLSVLHILFFLTGLSGIHGVSTVSHVSVSEGGSITIPCLYHHGSEKHVKYWCSGYFFHFCSTLIRTDSQSASNWLSIADNVTTRVFTVTMKNLQLGVSGYFWGAVEKGDTTHLYLSVSTGTAGLYVDQQHVTGVEGQSVTVNCNYSNSGGFCWCRLGGSCMERSVGNLDGASVEIKRILANGKKVMIVTMSQLKIKNTGWYWCAVGDLQIPVHITVSQPTTTQSNTTITNQNNGGTDEKRQERIQSLLVVLVIPLSLLVVLIVGTLVTLKIFRKHKDKKAKDQPPNTPVQSADSEQNITYSTVSHTRRTAQQDPLPDDAVTYSTVVTKNKTQPNAAKPDVVYSTVAAHQR